MSTTPNMSLILPVPTVTNGPEWATNVNTAFDVVDTHEHTPGKGVAVPSAGININADLEFNTFRAVEVKAIKHEVQTAALTGTINTNSIYVVNGDLYFNDGNGTIIQMTSGGSISTPSSANTPTGALFAYGGSSAPTGFLLCDGAAVSRVTFSTLFSIIGTSYGVGNGATTFNLPNMQGRTPIGAGTYTDSVSGPITRTVAEVLGAEKHVLTTPQMPGHTHNMSFTKGFNPGGSDINWYCSSTDAGHGINTKTTTAEGADVAHNNMQPSLGVNYIIKT